MTVPVLPAIRNTARAPPQIDAKMIDDIAARILPDVERQMHEETQRTADLLRQNEKQFAADSPTARGFPLSQGRGVTDKTGQFLAAQTHQHSSGL